MFQIIWSPRAFQAYIDILDYLSEISPDAALRLDDLVDKMMKRLSQFPHLCPPSPFKPDYRKCVISKNYSVVYKIRNTKIYIVSVIDNRQNPQS